MPPMAYAAPPNGAISVKHNLIDQYMLLIHPLVLGSGRRLFTDGGAFAALRLVDTKTTPTGVVIVTYRPKEQP